MQLMRIGPVGAEEPVVRVDAETYVDVSDVVDDFDESFFGGGGLDRLRAVADHRIAAGALTRGIGLVFLDHFESTSMPLGAAEIEHG